MALIAADSLGGNRLQGRPRATGWLLMAPLIIWLLVFVLVPTILLVIISFCDQGSIVGIKYDFNTDNYTEAFKPFYLKILIRSLVLSFECTVICLILGFPVGYFIGRADPKWRTILMVMVMIPFWTSFLVRTYAWMTILAQGGILNAALMSLKIVQEPLQMLNTEGAVLLGLVYNYLPFMILPIYTAAERLDQSIIEASYDLGCGPLRSFQKVIIPMMMPGLIAGSTLVFVPAIGMFAISGLMGGGSNQMIGDVIYKQFTSARNQPFGAALGTMLLVTFLVTLWFTSRQKKR